MSRFVWGNTDGKIWINKPYIPEPFVMSGTTPSDGDGEKSLTIGNIEPQDEYFTIDWGDGITSTFTSAIDALYSGNEYTHTYADYNTEYIVTITGAKISDSGTARFTALESTFIEHILNWGENFIQNNASNICTSLFGLKSIPDNWFAFRNVTNMKYAFFNCKSLLEIPSAWKYLENVTDISHAWRSCYALNGMPLSWSGLENVSTIDHMFSYCTSLVTIPTSWNGLEGVTNFYYAFAYCTSLVSLPSSWVGLENVTNFGATFNNCRSIVSLPNSWAGLEGVTNFYYAFRSCTSLVSLPSSWAGLESVTNFSWAFAYCTSLVTIGITDYESLSNVTDCSSMFKYTAQITSDILALYNQLVTTATSFGNCFTGLTLAENYASIPDSWKGL